MQYALRSSPQCYRSRVGMLTIICVDAYALKPNLFSCPQLWAITEINKYLQSL